MRPLFGSNFINSIMKFILRMKIFFDLNLFVNDIYLFIGERGQTKTFNNCCFFTNENVLKETITKLPRAPEECGVIFKYPGKNDTTITRGIYAIRPDKIREALKLLIRINKWYKNISIDESVMTRLEADQAQDEANNVQLPAENQQLYSGFVGENVGGGNIVDLTAERFRNRYSGKTITIDGARTGLMYHSDPDIIAKAFPTLFPTGEGGNFKEYKKKMSLTKFLSHCMMFYDMRFCQSYRFLFVMVNLKNIESAYGGISALFQSTADNGDSQNQHEFTNQELNDMCDEEGKARIHVERSLYNHNIVMKQLRGTFGYWEEQKRKLFDMLAYLGPVDQFLSFSAADLYWPDVIVAMTNGDIPMDEAQRLTIKEREILLNQNQCMASYHFVKRFKEFFKSFILNPVILGAEVKDYVIRYETQYRGSVHAHVLLWVDYPKERFSSTQVEMCRDYINGMDQCKGLSEAQKEEMAVSLCYLNRNVVCFGTESNINQFLRFKTNDEILEENRGNGIPTLEELFNENAQADGSDVFRHGVRRLHGLERHVLQSDSDRDNDSGDDGDVEDGENEVQVLPIVQETYEEDAVEDDNSRKYESKRRRLVDDSDESEENERSEDVKNNGDNLQVDVDMDDEIQKEIIDDIRSDPNFERDRESRARIRREDAVHGVELEEERLEGHEHVELEEEHMPSIRVGEACSQASAVPTQIQNVAQSQVRNDRSIHRDSNAVVDICSFIASNIAACARVHALCPTQQIQSAEHNNLVNAHDNNYITPLTQLEHPRNPPVASSQEQAIMNPYSATAINAPNPESIHMRNGLHPSQIPLFDINKHNIYDRVFDLANTVNMHVCVPSYCGNNYFTTHTVDGVSKRVLVCSKGFPKQFPLAKATPFKYANGKLKLEPARDDPYVNNYHPALIAVHGANMDIQVLSRNGFAPAVYITSYVGKADKARNDEWRKNLRDLEKNMRKEEEKERDEIRQAATNQEKDHVHKEASKRSFLLLLRSLKSMVGQREMSAQEAALDAFRLPLISYSRHFEKVFLYRPEEIPKLKMKPRCAREELLPDAKGWDIWMKTHIVKYIERPTKGIHVDAEGIKKKVDMNEIPLLEFFAEWEVDNKSHVCRRRKKPYIIHIYPRVDLAISPKEYGVRMLTLFVPFRRLSDIMCRPDDPWRSTRTVDETFERSECTVDTRTHQENRVMYEDPWKLINELKEENMWPTKYTNVLESQLSIADLAAKNDQEEEITLEEAIRRLHEIEVGTVFDGTNGLTIQECEEMLKKYYENIDMNAICEDLNKNHIVSASGYKDAQQSKTNKKEKDFLKMIIPEGLVVFGGTNEEKLQEIQVDRNSIWSDQQLKRGQKIFVIAVLRSIHSLISNEIQQNNNSRMSLPRWICHIVLYGKAGTGKTTAIKRAKDLIFKYFGKKALLTFAPTANAALLLDGFTLHRVFKKSVRANDANYKDLDVKEATDLKLQFKDIIALFGDEMSMMTTQDLYLFDIRLRQARDSERTKVGNIILKSVRCVLPDIIFVKSKR